MSTHPTLFSPLVLLAALGVLSATQVSAAEVDTSQWKCAKCPFPQGATGSVDAGAGYTSDDSTTFGNYTGLQKKGPHLVLGGQLSYREEGGYFADVTASDLGIDTRSLSAQTGREGLYSLGLGYAEVPRYFAEGARTPFRGNGGSTLTNAGVPAADTASMNLPATLQPVELGYKASRFDLGGTWVAQDNWAYRVNLRRDVRDGTKPTSGSFFSTASQLAQPVDHTTDQLEVAAAYATKQFQASLAYQLSQFKNGNDSLTWDNPFLPVVPGATRGQLALTPDNQFQQLVASAGYQISETLRASADLAYGQGRQNATYLDPTLNTDPAAGLPGRAALPAQSPDGQVTTFNFNAKLTAAPMEGLRLNAIYARDIRDNETAIQAYPHVATDMFADPLLSSNVPFTMTQDRVKLNADYRGLGSWKLSGGLDWDNRQRTYQEVVQTRETTLWGRATVQALDELGLTFNLAYGDRNNSTYGSTTWFGSPQNPLMRKFNLAARERATAGARADWTISETVSLGLGADWANDDYYETVIGLNESKTVNLVADIAVALSESTRLHAFGQSQKVTSRQTGSEAYAGPDWTGKVNDRFDVLGFGIKHAAIPDKLDLGADLSFSRSHSDTSVQTVLAEPAFPQARTSLDTVKLYATYKLQEALWLTGSWWYERYDSTDWRLDGVQPATVSNLLAFGTPAPQYRVNVLRVALRYRF